MFATMTSKGQLTIPKEIRDQLGLKPGDRLDFKVDGSTRAVMEKESEKKYALEDIFDYLGPAPIGRTVTLAEIEEGVVQGAIHGERDD
jgi:AbrB family looped-hinge helix DNA binding protein